MLTCIRVTVPVPTPTPQCLCVFLGGGSEVLYSSFTFSSYVESLIDSVSVLLSLISFCRSNDRGDAEADLRACNVMVTVMLLGVSMHAQGPFQSSDNSSHQANP